MESVEIPNFVERPTILVVDDTADNLTLMSALLKDSYKVKVANNGEKALKYLQGDINPDLILLDIMMADLSGYDVIRELKANPKTRDIPVIFLTAMSAPEDEKKGLELDIVDAFLVLQDEFQAIAARFVDSKADIRAKVQQLELLQSDTTTKENSHV